MDNPTSDTPMAAVPQTAPAVAAPASAGFDMAALDTLSLSTRGMPMELIHPKTRAPLKNDDGSIVSITLMGRLSDEWLESNDRALTEARAAGARGRQWTRDDQERSEANHLAAVTVTWTISVLDGAPFPPTKQNILKFWNDRRFTGIREKAVAFVLEDGNFLAD